MPTFVENLANHMAVSATNTYDNIRAKVRVIIDRQQMLVEKINAQMAENEKLRSENENLQKQLQRMKVDYEFLTMASVIAHNREEVEQTRAMLAGLVRDIDRCIAELSAC